ncbi:hypothetical protein [Aureivirga marina]|uniref:hypothetical protein n=1 Tax=Aureivirga marina TaxID=1182451 RepID=UPI0018CBDC1F|nr:hypothetical protein [Aureivirga marina]
MIFKNESIYIDLAKYKPTFKEENSWFSDSFYTTYSFPFPIDFSDDLIQELGFIDDSNVSNKNSIYPGQLYVANSIYKASLILKKAQKNISAVIEFDKEEFKPFSRRIKTVDYGIISVGDIHIEANNTKEKNYPEVNYNFPMIRKQMEGVSFKHFGGFINECYSNGNWSTNTESNGEIFNRNIMQPFPYLLYVLKKSFEAEGYILDGEILQDLNLKTALIDCKPFFTTSDGITNFQVNIDHLSDFENTDTDYKIFKKSVPITIKGIYRLKGKFSANFGATICRISLLYGFDLQYEIEVKTIYATDNITEYFFDELIDSSVLNEETVLEIKTYALVPGKTVQATLYIDEEIENDEIKLIKKLKWIDFATMLPDLTIGEIFYSLKNHLNYDYKVIGNRVVMNKIINEVKNSEIIDLSKFEKLNPEITFNQNQSYALKSLDPQTGEIYIDSSETKIGIDLYAENTISSNLKILPFLVWRNLKTAYSNDDDYSNLRLLFYKGFEGKTIPLCYKNEDVIYPNNYIENWKEWISIRINSDTYKIKFNYNPNEIDLNIKSRIYMYGNIHLIMKKTYKVISSDNYEVTLETCKIS